MLSPASWAARYGRAAVDVVASFGQIVPRSLWRTCTDGVVPKVPVVEVVLPKRCGKRDELPTPREAGPLQFLSSLADLTTMLQLRLEEDTVVNMSYCSMVCSLAQRTSTDGWMDGLRSVR